MIPTKCSASFFSTVLPVLLGLLIGVLLCEAPVSWAEGRSMPGPDTRIIIRKDRQILELYRNGDRLREYRVCLGLDPRGPKRAVGDRRTPEGNYFICYKSTESQFHRFLGISYPGVKDAQAAFVEGLISKDLRDAITRSIQTRHVPPWDTQLGGWVGIHGYPTDPSRRVWIPLLYPKPHNWTDGCIAMWNFEIEDLYAQVPLGTPVTILP